MKKIIDYCVIAWTHEERGKWCFEAKVKFYMKDNWQPIGGVAVTVIGFCQALVKYEA